MSFPSRRGRRLAPLLLALALLVAAVRPAAAQGALAGVATRAEDGAPIAYALVRVLRADPRAGAPAAPAGQAITNANGRFHLGHLPAGDYRLQLARIGYEPVLSPALRVEDGRTVQHELRGASRALTLAAVTVRPDAGCVTLARIGDDARLATLWQEARKGVETRLAFERQFRYTRVAKQDGVVRYRLFRRGIHTVDTTRSEPDSVEARRRRRVADLRANGHKSADGRLTIPNEKDLLDEDYMRDQCLEVAEADASAGAGAVGLRFRSVSPRADVVDVDGTLWLDGGTFLARRLDVRWTRGGDAFGRASMSYDDVSVGGSPLRFPVGARATLEPSALLARAVVAGASSTMVIRYFDFEQVGAR